MQVGELKRRMTVVMDSIDTATWFHDTLPAVRSELTPLNEQVGELEIKIANGFTGTATRVELALSRGDITATRTRVRDPANHGRTGFRGHSRSAGTQTLKR